MIGPLPIVRPWIDAVDASACRNLRSTKRCDFAMREKHFLTLAGSSVKTFTRDELMVAVCRRYGMPPIAVLELESFLVGCSEPGLMVDERIRQVIAIDLAEFYDPLQN